MRKPTQIAIVTASLLGGAVAGGLVLTPALSGAQETDDPATTETTTEATTAPDDTTTTDPGTPDPAPAPDDDAADGDGWVAEALAPLVADGTITQEQADAVTDALDDARPHGGPGFGHGPGGRGWFGADLDTVAEALGLDVDALRDALADGQSIADLAEAAGIDVQTVIDAVLADVDARLADAVADGDLTQERADDLRARIAERLADVVAGDVPLGGPDGRPGGGLWGFGHHDGPDDDADDGSVDGSADAEDATTTTTG